MARKQLTTSLDNKAIALKVFSDRFQMIRSIRTFYEMKPKMGYEISEVCIKKHWILMVKVRNKGNSKTKLSLTFTENFENIEN